MNQAIPWMNWAFDMAHGSWLIGLTRSVAYYVVSNGQTNMLPTARARARAAARPPHFDTVELQPRTRACNPNRITAKSSEERSI